MVRMRSSLAGPDARGTGGVRRASGSHPTRRLRAPSRYCAQGMARTEGGAMVEFALILPMLLLVIWGIIDISRAFDTLSTLNSAVREGARAAAVTSSRPDTGVTASAIKTLVATAFQPVGAPLDTSQITITWDGAQSTVSATYQFQAMTPLRWVLTVSRSAVFRWEQTTAP